MQLTCECAGFLIKSIMVNSTRVDVYINKYKTWFEPGAGDFSNVGCTNKRSRVLTRKTGLILYTLANGLNGTRLLESILKINLFQL